MSSLWGYSLFLCYQLVSLGEIVRPCIHLLRTLASNFSIFLLNFAWIYCLPNSAFLIYHCLPPGRGTFSFSAIAFMSVWTHSFVQEESVLYCCCWLWCLCHPGGLMGAHQLVCVTLTDLSPTSLLWCTCRPNTECCTWLVCFLPFLWEPWFLLVRKDFRVQSLRARYAIIPTFERQRQECEFEASLGLLSKIFQKKKKGQGYSSSCRTPQNQSN